ncbi:methyl-accepting chemotaxis protein, partial [Pseudoalteromonas ruthenica]
DFHAVVELQKVIGLHPKDALYGELRGAVHKVETLLKQRKNFELLTTMLQLRRAEKDFMLRFNLKYLTKFDKLIATFNTQITQAGFERPYQDNLLVLVAEYQQKFGALVSAQQTLGLSLD